MRRGFDFFLTCDFDLPTCFFWNRNCLLRLLTSIVSKSIYKHTREAFHFHRKKRNKTINTVWRKDNWPKCRNFTDPFSDLSGVTSALQQLKRHKWSPNYLQESIPRQKCRVTDKELSEERPCWKCTWLLRYILTAVSRTSTPPVLLTQDKDFSGSSWGANSGGKLQTSI